MTCTDFFYVLTFLEILLLFIYLISPVTIFFIMIIYLLNLDFNSISVKCEIML